jgi:DnaJ-class molecular chaperone
MPLLLQTDANPHRDTTEAFSLLNRAYEVLMHPELRQRYDLYGKQGVGTSAMSDLEKIDESKAAQQQQQTKDWTQVLLVEPYKTISVIKNQTHSHGDHQDVKWKKDPPPYEESLVKYQSQQKYSSSKSTTPHQLQLKQAVNEERTYGHVVQDYQSLANTNWESCMKNSMDETKFLRPKHAQRCLYSILGVPPQATAEQLQTAFAVATEDYHPTMDLGRFVCGWSWWWLSSNIFLIAVTLRTGSCWKQSTNLCSLPPSKEGIRYFENPIAAAKVQSIWL